MTFSPRNPSFDLLTFLRMSESKYWGYPVAGSIPLFRMLSVVSVVSDQPNCGLSYNKVQKVVNLFLLFIYKN